MTGPEQKNENIQEHVQEQQKELDSKKIEAAKPEQIKNQLEKNQTKEPEAKDIKDVPKDITKTTPETKNIKTPWEEKVVDANGKYQPRYTEFVNNVANDPTLLNKVISEAKLSYVTDKDSFVKFATDHKLWDLHEYLKNNFPTMEAKDNTITEPFREVLDSEHNEWVNVTPRGSTSQSRQITDSISKYDLLKEMKPIIEKRAQEKWITQVQAKDQLFKEWSVRKTIWKGVIWKDTYDKLQNDNAYQNILNFLHSRIN